MKEKIKKIGEGFNKKFFNLKLGTSLPFYLQFLYNFRNILICVSTCIALAYPVCYILGKAYNLLLYPFLVKVDQLITLMCEIIGPCITFLIITILFICFLLSMLITLIFRFPVDQDKAENEKATTND